MFACSTSNTSSSVRSSSSSSRPLGGTICVSVAQSVFQNKFLLYLRATPTIDAEQIISHGLSTFRELTSAADLPLVVE
ncbi:hypothetical protein OC846_004382 [Tilletia horrida]|uniref:Uncharacterized protein n=1 Tax=Tilletia horrida TaxID=155126 RepID=A0AAN6JSV6_9BASI|nr:hypothetical protein OC845_003925 [Tilletia horrida]KAK0548694.1 hypothetical protein OC846_004382 [Tilletia horrida]KAK0566933.1 hypothetical protein OC861_002976 [Tilletia horrida]